MRVSTPLMFQLGSDAIQRAQSDMLRTQQEIAAGKRMLAASDDPVAASQALMTRAARAEIGRLNSNVAAAKDALGFDDSILGQISEVMQSVRTLAINAGNAALSDADRRSLASDAASRLEQLLALANSRDANGNYLYSGYESATQPFASSGGAVTYNGDQGRRQIEVSPGRIIDLTENGSELFEHVRTGNGTFVTDVAAANAGSGIISVGTVTTPAALTGHTYTLQFNVSGGATTYDVLDVTAATTVSTGNAYTSGASISLAGMQFAISGTPANGDTFTVAPSTSQSVFTTLKQLVSTLQAPGGSPAASAQLTNGLSHVLQNVDQALEHVLTARTDVGAKLRELDVLGDGNDGRNLQYEQELSRLEDLDYSKALSHFTQQQAALEAAQRSFLKVTGLSLFDLL